MPVIRVETIGQHQAVGDMADRGDPACQPKAQARGENRPAVAKPSGDGIEIGGSGRVRNPGEPLELVQAAAELDRALAAPHQPDHEHRDDRPDQPAFIGGQQRRDPALTDGSADQSKRYDVGQDEAQQEHVAVRDEVVAGQRPAKVAKRPPDRGSFASGKLAGGQIIASNGARSIHRSVLQAGRRARRGQRRDSPRAFSIPTRRRIGGWSLVGMPSRFQPVSSLSPLIQKPSKGANLEHSEPTATFIDNEAITCQEFFYL
jgi:hypothetical protein